MKNKPGAADLQNRQTAWFSRIVRWLFGGVFICVGILFFNQGGWPVLVFGIVIFLTGFLKPRRCMNNDCTLP
jgi:uncharacterized membrane protein